MLSDATLKAFIDLGIVQFGTFTLKSGAESPIYLDLRRLISDPAILRTIAEAMQSKVVDLSYDRIAGIPTAGLPIGTALSLASGTPMIYPRMEAKKHGTGRSVEGLYEPGERVLMVDDVISGATSKREAIQIIEAVGLVVEDVIVVVDRNMGGVDTLAADGYRVHALMNLRGLLARLRDLSLITVAQYEDVITRLDSQ